MDVMTQHPDSSEPHNTHYDGWRHGTCCPISIFALSLSCTSPFLISILFLFTKVVLYICFYVYIYLYLYVHEHVSEIDQYPVLSVTWLIDVQSKQCSFACMPLEGRVNEASVARSACFFIIERQGERERKCISLIKCRILKGDGQNNTAALVR